MLDHLRRVGALATQAFVQPLQRGRGARVLITQPLGQFRREHFGQRPAGARRNVLVQRGLRATRRQQVIGQPLGIGSHGAARRNLVGQPPQVFHEHDTQGDGDGPQLADVQRLHFLVGSNEAAQHHRVDMAVGVGNVSPGQPEHTRIPGEGTIGQLGQQAVVARRQVDMDFADLFFDDVVVVEQPFSRRHNAAAGNKFRRAGAIRRQQLRGIDAQAFAQRRHGRRLRRDLLRGSQAARVLFKAFDAEQFFANR